MLTKPWYTRLSEATFVDLAFVQVSGVNEADEKSEVCGKLTVLWLEQTVLRCPAADIQAFCWSGASNVYVVQPSMEE